MCHRNRRVGLVWKKRGGSAASAGRAAGGSVDGVRRKSAAASAAASGGRGHGDDGRSTTAASGGRGHGDDGRSTAAAGIAVSVVGAPSRVCDREENVKFQRIRVSVSIVLISRRSL